MLAGLCALTAAVACSSGGSTNGGEASEAGAGGARAPNDGASGAAAGDSVAAEPGLCDGACEIVVGLCSDYDRAGCLEICEPVAANADAGQLEAGQDCIGAAQTCLAVELCFLELSAP